MNYPSLPTIWQQSAKVLRAQWRVFTIGVVIFAAISTVILQKALEFMTLFITESALWQDLGGSGFLERMQSTAIDPTTMFLELQTPERMVQMQEFALKAYTELVPVLIIAALLVSLVAFIAMKFYLIATVKQHSSARTTFVHILKYLLPEFFLSMWVFMRSFSWVPFIGPLLALIFTPRYTLAGIYLVRDHVGIFTSAHTSFERTRGHWWYIVRSVYVTCLVTMLLFTGIRIATLFIPNMLLQMFLLSVVAHVFLAFCTIAMVKIGEVLMKPKR